MAKQIHGRGATPRGRERNVTARQPREFAPTCPHGLGATLTAEGVHFAVYSSNASGVEVCLYDAADPSVEVRRAPLARDENDVWHAFLPQVRAGALYGYRAEGPWQPEHGNWFNARKLLIDPYAKAIQGKPVWNPLMANISSDDNPDSNDSGPSALKSVVIRDEFDWQHVTAPARLWKDTVIYEMHVRGFSMLNQAVPAGLRGTYAGLAHSSSIEYLKELGVTAVQLLPVHQHLDDGFLIKHGLTNYWGYNTLGFFAPQNDFAAATDPQEQVNEFKTMVRELHRAGLEVILDVVYNHTAEGNEKGLLLSLRGLDNAGYYMLDGDRRTVNYTGCGNTVNAASSPALRLVLDSLRYWVEQMHVDGFRFDLAATLGRNGDSFNRDAAFFLAIAADPILSRVKLIAEPWDIGPHGYQPGGFPKPWRETSGPYRDATRSFWRGAERALAEFAKRLCGSDDIYGPTRRGPLASVNMLTCHDGFTLRDLWSYNNKHNDANQENNRDGEGNNHSWNCGVEGETTDAEVLATRRKLARACYATLFCSLGVPFMVMGDERWRTQQGNNNAYCQDNAISWLDWSANDDADAMFDFTKRMIRFRQQHPALHRSKHFTGEINQKPGSSTRSWFDWLTHFTGEKPAIINRPDVEWLDANGKKLVHEEWHNPHRRFFAAILDAPDVSLMEGEARDGGPILLLFNASPEDVAFTAPPGNWVMVFDTSLDASFPKQATVVAAGGIITSSSRSVACFLLEN
jgi:isoamylase